MYIRGCVCVLQVLTLCLSTVEGQEESQKFVRAIKGTSWLDFY
jgi:hypothetical protein